LCHWLGQDNAKLAWSKQSVCCKGMLNIYCSASKDYDDGLASVLDVVNRLRLRETLAVSNGPTRVGSLFHVTVWRQEQTQFVGVFAKLWKATISFVVYVCPSACNNSAPTTVFHEIWYLSIFRKSVEKIKVWLKSKKNNEYFTWRPMYIYDNISLNSS
jgi:hypothetical protein